LGLTLFPNDLLRVGLPYGVVEMAGEARDFQHLDRGFDVAFLDGRRQIFHGLARK
jgi:hypothetical protein